MKIKLLSLFILFIFCGVCWAEDVNIQAIINIESSGNPNAYNKRSEAIGLCQITPIVLKEFNNSKDRHREFNKMCIWDTPYLTIKDLYNPYINKIVGEWYINKKVPEMLKAYHIKDTIEARLACYNEGIGLYRKGIMTKETRNYIVKYKKLTGRRS